MDFSKKEQIQTAGDKAIQTQMSDFNNCNVTINSSELIRSIATEVCSKELLIFNICFFISRSSLTVKSPISFKNLVNNKNGYRFLRQFW